jgi:hypothetical protein
VKAASPGYLRVVVLWLAVLVALYGLQEYFT